MSCLKNLENFRKFCFPLNRDNYVFSVRYQYEMIRYSSQMVRRFLIFNLCLNYGIFCCSIIHGLRTGISISHLILAYSILKLSSFQISHFFIPFSRSITDDKILSPYTDNSIIRNLSRLIDDSDSSMTLIGQIFDHHAVT